MSDTTPSEAQSGFGRKVKGYTRAFWREWRGFLIFLIVMFSFRSAIADWNDVPSGSMLPTILIGDRILVDKLAYDLKLPFTTVHMTTWGQPKRGDIVVFYSPADGVRLVKRVIGIPGDRVSMTNNHLVINDVPVQYEARGEANPDPKDAGLQELKVEQLDGRPHLMLVTPQRPAMRSFPSVEVPAGEFLMMGDNRDNSNDWRYIGFVPRSEILGRASRVVFSLDPDHWYAPRSGRFLAVLN
jgi:signal peptidase I